MYDRGSNRFLLPTEYRTYIKFGNRVRSENQESTGTTDECCVSIWLK